MRINITRAHLEEDVGKNFHFDRHSGVDFNRAGVPLLEIVSEPDLTSADMAYEYLNALKEVLIYGGISDCDMEKGMVRCDVNISVRPVGTNARRTPEKLFMFLISIFAPSSCCPVGRTLTFTSQRTIPFSMSQSLMPP